MVKFINTFKSPICGHFGHFSSKFSSTRIFSKTLCSGSFSDLASCKNQRKRMRQFWENMIVTLITTDVPNLSTKIEGLIYKSLLNARDGKKTKKEHWIELRHVQAASTRYLTLPVPIPDEEKKMKLNFYFHTSFWSSKSFMTALKAFIKPYEAPQISVKIKI